MPPLFYECRKAAPRQIATATQCLGIQRSQVNMRNFVLALLLFSVRSTHWGALAQSSTGDIISFPATGEFDLVFPRNETYAVEAPFPVILGFQQASALLSFSSVLSWTLECVNGTLFGIGRVEGQRAVPPTSDPYFYVNASDTVAKIESEGDQFKYFRGDHDICVLRWEFKYLTTCERLSDGRTEIRSGSFGPLVGNTTFTLRPGAKSARSAMENYEECAAGGVAINVASNLTGCVDVADDVVGEPQPCDLDVEGAASSLINAMVSPTTSLTAVPTKTMDSTTGSSNAKPTKGTSDGNAENDEDNAAGRISSRISVWITIVLSSCVLLYF